ncbi:Golgi SNAP receptor complex member 2 [Homalodisca vitripennis]|nr:Golgi SNAP receptor complex member 2 [Homalodisca vitripennis]
MEALYHQTNRLLQETQQCFQDLSLKNPETEKEIQARIDQITSNCEKLDIMVHKEPISRRQNAKIRVDQLKYDNKHLQGPPPIEIQEEEFRALISSHVSQKKWLMSTKRTWTCKN